MANFLGDNGDDTLTGGALADILLGFGGEDSLLGGAGNDLLVGEDGSDTLDGGTGSDTLIGGFGSDLYIADTSADVILEGLGGGTDTVRSSVSLTLASNLENLTLIGTANNGTGNELNNVITASNSVATNNILSGLVGNDTLDGGTGIDTLNGGTGDDVYIVDTTTDVISEVSTAGGTDTVQSSVDFSLGSLGLVENLSLTGNAIVGIGNGISNKIEGNNIANNLSGGRGNDRLDSGGGNDTLTGGSGDDTMVGGGGSDTYIVDSTLDVLFELTTEIDLVQSSATFTLASQVENLTLTGVAAINGTGNSSDNEIIGNSAANFLIGNAGKDTLTGSDGSDTLSGGNGSDVLTGGVGSDRYVFDTNSVYNASTIGIDTVNASFGTDRIVLDKSTFTFLNSVAGNGFSNAAEFATVGSDALAGGTGARIIYNSANGNLFYDTNGAGAGFGTGSQFATINPVANLAASDFVIQA
jgi:Ca2+-binding RTX toxin-like protein